MPRLARVVVPGIPHHITQRGTRRQDVFFSDEDRQKYLMYLKEASERFGVTIWAWCLMSNHVHFIAVPKEKDSLALCFGRAHTRYTCMINLRNEWRGFLWQGRFHSSPMDESYTYTAIRYVLRNPVRAGIVRRPWQYPWSSAAFHVGVKQTDPLVKTGGEQEGVVENWRKCLTEPSLEEELTQLRRETAVGRPLGNPDFVQDLETKLKRVLTRRSPGRREN